MADTMETHGGFMNIPHETDLAWLRENALHTYAAVLSMAAGSRKQRYCPRCQKPMEYLPGADGYPGRWFCKHRLPYRKEFCGYETEDWQ